MRLFVNCPIKKNEEVIVTREEPTLNFKFRILYFRLIKINVSGSFLKWPIPIYSEHDSSQITMHRFAKMRLRQFKN